ncbi:MAG: hypothetical protein LWX11_05290, partial [Firmicutes bacterium]|nr:hypothetical protein [Bacillota bacterium]
MILREALHAIPRRLKRPLILGMILAFTALGVGYIPVMAMVIRTAPPPHPYLPPVTFGLILNTLLSVVHTFGLSALPWQWTGDDRRLAPAGRGLLQSVLFSASFSALVMLMRLDMLKQTYAHLPHVPDFPEAFRVVAFGLSMIVGLFFSCLIGFIVAFWEARQAEKAEALKRAEEARWALLKAQMSPHVL